MDRPRRLNGPAESIYPGRRESQSVIRARDLFNMPVLQGVDSSRIDSGLKLPS